MMKICIITRYWPRNNQRRQKSLEKRFSFQVDLSDVIFGLLAFFVFYMTFPAEELAQRIVQSALMAGVFVLVLGQLNGNRRREKQRIAPDADERNQAEMIMESSGLAGEPCTVSFYEDSFQLENPGITTSYRYEGVSWIKETEQYYMIFWTRSTVIPVEKGWLLQGHSQPVQSLSGEKMPEDHYESQIRK